MFRTAFDKNLGKQKMFFVKRKFGKFFLQKQVKKESDSSIILYLI